MKVSILSIYIWNKSWMLNFMLPIDYSIKQTGDTMKSVAWLGTGLNNVPFTIYQILLYVTLMKNNKSNYTSFSNILAILFYKNIYTV